METKIDQNQTVKSIRHYKNLRVYLNAYSGALQIFELSKRFPLEEKYSLVDQIRRSSRSVCANLAEAWRKRRYQAAFKAKLNDAESEASETQVWLNIAKDCKYLNDIKAVELEDLYDHILAQLVLMVEESDKWLIK